jgi:2-oxoglutarate dehydrogenase E1 component
MGNEAQTFLPELGPQDGPQPGPSWANARWPLDDGGDLTAGDGPDGDEARRQSSLGQGRQAGRRRRDRARRGDSIRAMMLVRTYRVRGHLAPNLDPLGLSKLELPADLTPEYHGFTGEALDRPVYLGGTLGFEWGTVRELVGTLRANYCGHVGLEYMHLADVEERRFLQDRIEGPTRSSASPPRARRRSSAR